MVCVCFIETCNWKTMLQLLVLVKTVDMMILVVIAR